jgi:hypothetical protein
VAGSTPFTADEREELGQVAGCIFDGGYFPPSLLEAKKKWGYLIEMFLVSVNRENGSIQHLPMDSGRFCGLFHQPSRTMKVFRFLQDKFIRRINKKINEISKRR